MAGFSTYLKNKLVAHAFGGVPYTAPSTVYVALYTAAPTDGGGGTELSGGGYARTTATFTVTDNTATNDTQSEFPAATANWGVVTHGAVFDAATAGNMLGWGPLASSRDVQTDDIFRISSGDLTISLVNLP